MLFWKLSKYMISYDSHDYSKESELCLWYLWISYYFELASDIIKRNFNPSWFNMTGLFINGKNSF